MHEHRRIWAAIATISAFGLLAGASATSGSTAAGPPVSASGLQSLLCGLNPVIDRLLDCPAPQPQPQPQQTQQGATEQTSSASTETTSSASTETTSSASTGTSTTAAPSLPLLEPGPPVLGSSTRPSYEPNMLLVRFRPGASPTETAALLHQLGATTDTKVSHLGVRSVLVDPARRAAVLSALARSPLVAHAERDLVFGLQSLAPNDAFYSLQWGLSLGGFSNAWNSTHGSRSFVVGVVDSGVDATQPDLAGVIMHGVDLVDGTGSTNDQNGHGTAVAGVIAARADNHIGGAGVCWTCKILPIKVTGADGKADTAVVAQGIVKAADLGAKVINVSMGAPQQIDALQQAVDYAASKGAIVLAAAGNSGGSTKFYPAGYPNVISVAGSDKNDRLYGWSNRGSWVSVAAPGCNVAPLLDHRGYGEFCGTSSATPLVAGLVALVLSERPGATSAEVGTAIDRAAKRIHANVRFGRIDAGASLARILRLGV
jgi:subtilisin family serine protease